MCFCKTGCDFSHRFMRPFKDECFSEILRKIITLKIIFGVDYLMSESFFPEKTVPEIVSPRFSPGKRP